MKTEWVVCDIAGTGVPHAHIHIVPRHNGDGHGEFINPSLTKKMTNEEMTAVADKIRESF